MGNTYLRIPDTLIRKSFQEVYDELSKKVEIKTTGSGISIATANALYSMNIYGYQQLQQDLKKGVSLVFKDITEFDETFPSAIAIGDIELNEDSTVKYGSRGVAITKNGLAGFDETYNGAGDLPSFSLDTHGNLYLRGEVHAKSGTFAGELKSAYGTFDTITAGVLQNSDGSNKIDLNASGSQYFITLGWLDYLRSDGRFRLGNGTLRWDGTTFKLTSTDDTPNENVNYNFDDGTNGWSISAALEKQVVRYDDSSVPSDCPDIHCLKVKNPENADKYIYNQDVEASEGEEFTYIAYVASDSSADYDITCYVVFLDNDKNWLSTGGSSVTINPTNSKWRKIVTRGKAPQNTAYARFGIRTEENANGTDAYWFITDCYLKRTRFGDDRVEISGRDISFYKTLETQPYKTVKKIESGVANNGDVINLTGFYDRTPKIIVSPNNLQIYESDNPNQDQTIKCYPYNLTGNTNTGEWSFIARAELVIATNDGSVVNFFDNDYIASCFTDNGYCNNCGEKSLPSGASKVSFNITANCYSVTEDDTDGDCLNDNYYRWNTDFYYRILVDDTDVTGWKYFGRNETSTSSQNISFSTDTIDIANKSKIEIEFKSIPLDDTKCTDISNSGRCNCVTIHCNYGVVIKDSTAYFDYAGDTKLADGSLNWIAIG